MSSAAPVTGRAPSVLASLRQSARTLAARPVVTLSLGAAVVLSLLSVCCGVGVITAPWFMAELFAVSLSEASGRRVERSVAWAGACSILLGAVLLVSSVAWLSLLGQSAQVPGAGPPRPASVRELLESGMFLAAVSSAAALTFILPFLYAPLILIERGGSVIGAMLESARLVRGSPLAHLRLSLVAHAVQAGPALGAALLAALTVESDLAPVAVLLSLPLLMATVPLGQGMIVVSYLERRERFEDPARLRWGGRPPRLLATVWVLLVLSPLLSFVMLGGSLMRPSRVAEGRIASREPVALLEPKTTQEQRYVPAGTALTIRARAHRVDVVASDGGGAGQLPLPTTERIERVRVFAALDAYGVEIHAGGRSYLTWVDPAGVRLDDSLRARLFDRVPTWGLGAMLVCLLVIGVSLLPVLDALARVRRSPSAPDADTRARVVARSSLVAVLLSPLAILSLYFGLLAVGLH